MSRLSRWIRSQMPVSTMAGDALRSVVGPRGFLGKPREPLALLKRGLSKKLGLTNAIHVGAHLAEERHDYEALGFTGVLWIEASAPMYRQLVQRLAESTGAKTRHIAVHALSADRVGQELTLRHFSNDGASNSIFPSTELIKDAWPGVVETGVTETVVSDTLDRIASAHGFASADLIAADVQGAELLVLKGATQLLSTARAVIVEVSQETYYNGGVLYPELCAFLNSRGFAEARRPPVHGDQLYVRV